MPLYTVLVNFSDHTGGIEQLEADSPAEAVRVFAYTAECLADYPRVDRLIDETRGPALIHVANSIRGLWIWVIADRFEDETDDDLDVVLGGYVVQTDPGAPCRSQQG